MSECFSRNCFDLQGTGNLHKARATRFLCFSFKQIIAKATSSISPMRRNRLVSNCAETKEQSRGSRE